MASMAPLPLVDRLLQLLQHFGLERAHVAAAVPGDWRALATAHADRIASLSLVCPIGIDPALAAVAAQAQLIHGDQGPIAERARTAVGRMPEVGLVTLAGYAGLSWSDVCAERGREMVPALLDFVRRMEAKHPAGARPLAPGAGEVAGLAYRVQGSGPPLVLLPLGLSSSQWEPILAQLGQHCCAIVLAGPHLGMVPLLEARGQAPGYSRMVRNLVQEIGLRPGERVAEIGCGTGVHTRWLAGHTAGANSITAVDINRYLLQEAQALARAAGLQGVITFQEGNGLALPLPDGGFDVTLSLTVLEEGHADRMLAELVRVTRPGGRVAAIVRGEDWPTQISLALPDELRARVAQAMGAGVTEGGCADASLYRRFRAAGLTDVRPLPQLAVYDDPGHFLVQYYQSRALGVLTAGEAQEWHAAVAQARAQGSFVLAVPHHCAVGTRA
jgi:SAM-dependent methyltransferase